MILLPTIDGSFKFHIGSLRCFHCSTGHQKLIKAKAIHQHPGNSVLDGAFSMAGFFNPLWFFLQNPILGWEI